MRYRKFTLAAAMTVLGSAAATMPAVAATPFNIGNGMRPSVTVDSAGNGYFAWLEKRAATLADPSQVQFCKVPVGATACSVRSQFKAPSAGLFDGTGSGYPRVFLLPGGQPTIFTGCTQCFGGVNSGSQFVSANGGASFQPRAGYGALGIIGAVAGSGKGDLDPAGNTIFAIQSSGEFQRMPIADPTQTPTVTAELGPFGGGSNDEAAVTYIGSGATQTHVAAFAGRAGTPEIRFKHHTNPSDPNVEGNWSGGGAAIAAGHHVALATGPSGIVLLSARESGPSVVEARRFVLPTKTFGPPVTLTTEAQGDGSISTVDVYQAANGRLHAFWRSRFGGTVPPGARYATSADGATWSAPQSIVADAKMFDAKIAGTADANRGWIVYANDDIFDNAIRVATLDPLPAPPPAPPPPPPPPPAVVPPPPPPVVPANYSGPRKTITVSDRSASYAFSVPRDCVAPGQAFTATLKWKKRKRKGNVFVKVVRVDFYRAAGRLRIDRKAPFVYRYRLLATQRRGASIALRARAFTKVRRGRAPKKSLRTRIKVCA